MRRYQLVLRTESRPPLPPSTVLGRGRSGLVVRVRNGERDIARKIFLGDAASTAVHLICSGAPGAYAWNASAVACAVARRNVLAELVPYWFGGQLRVARAYGAGWDRARTAHYLDTEFVEGRPVRLQTPYSHPEADEGRVLATDIMRPLQDRLIESGFDGLVWQAGRGNPVAANNFLRQADGTWSWIDLESGVPALVPINPLDLLRFYLPRSFRHRRPLYDDVDVDTLRTYVKRHRPALVARIGAERFTSLTNEIDRLARQQRDWRALRRLHRSLRHRLARGEVTPGQTAYYGQHPYRWWGRELRHGIRCAARMGTTWIADCGRTIARFDYGGAVRATCRYAGSQRYRTELARTYLARRIDRWQTRGQLDGREATALRTSLHRDGAAAYITDVGVHVALKLPVKALQLGVLPVLLGLGLVSPVAAAVFLAFGGALSRTAYTLGRLGMAALTHERLPWVALGVGVLPVVGTAAYAFEIVWSGKSRGRDVPSFIVYDVLTSAGEHLPVWGGRDTSTEHRANRMAAWLVRRRPATSRAPCGAGLETASQDPVAATGSQRRAG